MVIDGTPVPTWLSVDALRPHGVHGEEHALPVLHDVHHAARVPLLLGELPRCEALLVLDGNSTALKNRPKMTPNGFLKRTYVQGDQSGGEPGLG